MPPTLTAALSGITCPLVTPFDESGDIDADAFGDLVEFTVDGGIDGIFPCGTTGEFASLSPAERRRVTELAVDHADGEVPVLAGAAATSVAEALSAIEDIAAVGADAAVVTPPYFHTANDPAGNRRFFEAVADESPLPLLLYNIPSCTGRGLAPETIDALATREDVIGLKDSSGDLEFVCDAIRRTPAEFRVVQGYDALLVPALRMGADGGVNALANVVPEVYAEVAERADDERGGELQGAVSRLFDACGEYGFAPATKTALTARGVIPTDAVRPPLVEVPPAGRTAIENSLEEVLSLRA
ncbi:dihydrodipicolinate synthase family protein [Natrialba aegyptia]|uniref:Dihydrodipicolinate synthase n=1 Tax=Natrialba aegyptia DSM 13077 TaxID=1227491 RepID=M0B050_9EURY|nr:dihydrodipicolinate synthase family protein [Natrialba aegyptia]ELZ04165.1 dihydrodipicolinate synthase [Natrialba aegyptia DSM 13077]